jgi:hypothetical protein
MIQPKIFRFDGIRNLYNFGQIFRKPELLSKTITCVTTVILLLLLLSFLGSTAQISPWPSLQNPAEFLGGFSTIFFFYRVGLLAPRPTPIPEDQATMYIIFSPSVTWKQLF